MLLKLQNLFDRQIVEVSHPQPVFRPLDEDKSRRDLLGYKVQVKYKNHTKERFFALKKATNELKKGTQNRHREAEKRAWKYNADMHEKMMSGRR